MIASRPANSTPPERAVLVLEDGREFRGWRFGASSDAVGEVVFNTAMTGYQEILGDPSYAGQIVVMTYPMIGNYGIAPEDFESQKVYLKGLIVKEPSRIASNWRHQKTLDDYLYEHDVPGFYGLDTRALVRHLRDHGAMRGVFADVKHKAKDLIARAKASPEMSGCDLATGVSCAKSYAWTEPPVRLVADAPAAAPHGKFHVVVYDFGVKRNILRQLVGMGCEVTVVPSITTAKDVLALKPDGVVLSNGPGDPAPVKGAVDNVKALLGKVPIFGICLGHQILGIATGATTYKLKFGHHGANHPVMDKTTGKVEITSQNHGFAIDAQKLPKNVELTHVNLNDQTVSGIRVKDAPAFSVQYHPEAAPGPSDSRYLFDRFANLMTDWQKNPRSKDQRSA
jgi:carbamoyl-phosphate synthase small subunit